LLPSPPVLFGVFMNSDKFVLRDEHFAAVSGFSIVI
jgi:hypothetical protein